jgi:hypothetical protein
MAITVPLVLPASASSPVIVIGWLTFEIVDRRIVILLIALTTLGFTLRWFLSERLRPPPPRRPEPARRTHSQR